MIAETLIDDDRNITYEFSAGFDYSRKYNDLKRDYQADYREVTAGGPCIDIFIAVMTCSLATVNGESVKAHEKATVIEQIIERFGVQCCSYVCHKIMFSTYVGEIEGKKLASAEKWTDILALAQFSRAGIFSKAGFLWVTVAASFGALGCLILNGLQRLI